MNKLFVLFSVIICSQYYINNKTFTAETAESLNTTWNNAWNKGDSSTVVNMIADGAILADGKMEMVGKQKIALKFVHQYIGKIANLKSIPLQFNSGKEICYYSGLYSFDILDQGKLKGKENGRYTFIWKKQSDGIFKLTVLHMQEFKTPAQN